MQTHDGLLTSDIYIIDVVSGAQLYSISVADYPLYMEFLSDSRLVMAYSDKLVLWDVENNAQLASYDFGWGNLQSVFCTGRYIGVAYGGASR